MIRPNSSRIIVELIRTGDKDGQVFLPSRENVKAGENLYVGKVIAPGDSGFNEGQIVMFMEYSMAGFFKDVNRLVSGEATMSEAMNPENQYYVVDKHDVMAYDAA